MNPHDDLVPHMRRVHTAERDLRDLGLVWQMIESSAAISCPESGAAILPTLVNTRQRFDGLQRRLIEQMAAENRAALADELAARAQCAIDILVRNLFERTADVGFLATDDPIRAFCAATPEQRKAQQGQIVARLRDYQSKYTVYDDILLLSPQGAVLARLDGDAAGLASTDPIVAQALGSAGWVERFARSDLQPEGDPRPVLHYAHRIASAQGALLGVLVLRFRFLDEMQRIFADMEDDHHQIALMLVDAEQRVIATNDEAHVPTGALLRAVPEADLTLTAFAGREYLAVCCASRGYQGYAGPGWRAQAMVSLLTAFRQREDVAGMPENVPIENEELIAICHDADAINRDLRRVVWNGRLACTRDAGATTADARDGADTIRLKAVLNQVNGAGTRTRSRVDDATRDLYRTTLSRTQTQAADLARLAADIMDRNLYERANDCRWWALSPAIAQGLGAGPDAAGGLAAVLDHINSLYTVYSRLVVFDAQGRIRAVSRADELGQDPVGGPVDPAWLAALASHHDAQRYAVSSFGPTALHGHGDTYVYLAAIRAPQRDGLLGGIALVFHGQRELHAMLHEVLGGRTGYAAFVDEQGRVLASTDAALTQGAAIGFAGERAVIEHQGVHYACSRVRAKGYREFKRSDGYDNRVHAVVGLRLGAAERRHAALSDLPLLSAAPGQRQTPHELAIFQVGSSRYAIPAAALIEAVAPKGLVRTPTHHPLSLGLLEVQDHRRPRMLQVMCARRCFGVGYPSRATDGVVLVLRSPADPELPVVGLQVDDVLTVLAVPPEQIHPAPQGVGAFAPWVAGMLDCEVQIGGQSQRVLVQVLDPRRVAAELLGPLGLPVEPATPLANTAPAGALAMA